MAGSYVFDTRKNVQHYHTVNDDTLLPPLSYRGSGSSSCPQACSSLKPSRWLWFSLQNGAREQESFASSRDPGEKCVLSQRRAKKPVAAAGTGFNATSLDQDLMGSVSTAVQS
ncbi:MAG: hypothetical protein PVG45_10130 [Gammaproteobacteria bacterium]|jgi:hypothetical protein